MFKVTGSLWGSWNIKVTEGTSSGLRRGAGGSPILQVANTHYTDVDSIQENLSKVTWPDNDTWGPEDSQASPSQGDNSRE